jgi:hypothetical protein
MATLLTGGTNKPTRRDDQLTGVVTRLASIPIKVYKITLDGSGNFVSATLETTVTSDAQGNVSNITVTGAAGTLYRLVISDDGQKRCGFWDQLAV